SLTPALCATFLKPISAGHHAAKRGFFGWFNRNFDRTSRGYSGLVERVARRSGRFMIIYLALLIGLGWAYMRLPTAFLPNEDQGYLIVDLQAPSDASASRTLDVIRDVEKIFMAEEAVDRVVAILGFSFSGVGQNAALTFVTLQDWDERDENNSAAAIAARTNGQ